MHARKYESSAYDGSMRTIYNTGTKYILKTTLCVNTCVIVCGAL